MVYSLELLIQCLVLRSTLSTQLATESFRLMGGGEGFFHCSEFAGGGRIFSTMGKKRGTGLGAGAGELGRLCGRRPQPL